MRRSTLKLNNSIFAMNSAILGGVVAGTWSYRYISLLNSFFVQNRATFMGGALYFDDFEDLEKGKSIIPEFELSNLVFIANKAVHGGAIFFNDDFDEKRMMNNIN